jgi:hypothetical protein
MSYSDGIDITYDLTAVDFTGGANEDLAVGHGPKGLTGRVKAITCIPTTGITVAASTIDVGVPSGDADGYATVAADIAAIGVIVGGTDLNNDITAGVLGNLIPADTAFAIGNGGGSTAGVGNVQVVIEWS